MMEKKIIKIDIDDKKSFDANNSSTGTYILDVIKWATDMYKSGATHIRWTAYGYDGDVDEINAQAYQEREETDAEFLQREADEEKSAINREKNRLEDERKQYLKLKQKFEPKN